jgi:hypothetical protein
MERLRVSADGRRLETRTGRPFFYLADTAWTLPQRLAWDDALEYLHRRKMQGFTAVQIVALDPERDVGMRSPAGEPALHGGDLDAPNEAYFRYLDRIVRTAEHLGLYVLLLPAWGQLVVGENWAGETFPKTVREDNAFRYGQWIGARYRDQDNVIWCLGGDRHPVHGGVDYRDVWRRMAEGLLQGVTGRSCRYDDPDPAWQELLIAYHPCFELATGEYSSMSYWTDEEAWLSVVAVLAGEYARRRTLPVLDAEPAYERMPTHWPGPAPLHDDWIVRKRAYWSLLAGSCGHTYGHASVWCMISERERDEVLDASWYEALSSPGAAQMTILRELVESASFERWVPDQGLVPDHATACGDGCLDQHRQAARDRDGHFLLVYLTNGGRERVDLSALASDPLFAAWFDPRSGRHADLSGAPGDEPTPVSRGPAVQFEAPTAGAHSDWVLLVSDDPAWVRDAGRPRSWGEPLERDTMSMIWA